MSSGWSRWRSARTMLPILLLLAAAGAGYCRYLGYPAGPLYKPVPTTGPASDARRGTVALFFSGDLGFNTGMGPKIAAHIAARGIPVLGVNSLSAFAHRRSPQETRLLVRQAIARALAQPGARRLVVIGQSFGADALLTGLKDLPPADRDRIVLAAFIVPQDTLSFRATPGGLFSFGNDGPSLPAAKTLDWVPTLCIHGETEPESLCPSWTGKNVTRIALPGGHFLNDDSGTVAAVILRALDGHLRGG